MLNYSVAELRVNFFFQPRTETYYFGNGTFSTTLLTNKNINLIKFYINIFNGAYIFYYQSRHKQMIL